MDEGRLTGAEPDPREVELESASVRAFLIADVRGYTKFTREHGDEAAAALAAAYAEIVRDVIEAAGGELVELRGDEALCVFESPRQALRAAMALRDRLIDETVAHPERPLGTGIGLDVGEAVPVEGGYRGGALNVAARLCSLARAGQIIASREFVHLARKVEGIRYVEIGRAQLKGLERTIHAVRVEPENEDSTRRDAFAAALREGTAPKKRTRALIAGITALALIIAAVGYLALRDDSDDLVSQPNAVGAIELSNAQVSGSVEVGTKPVALAYGAGSLWVTNEESDSVSRVDPANNSVEQTIPIDGRPLAITFGNDAVWVSIAEAGRVDRINPATNTVVQEIDVAGEPVDLALKDDVLWVVNRLEQSVESFDTNSGRALDTIAVGAAPAALAIDEHIWVANSGDGTVSRIDLESARVLEEIAVGNGPSDVAIGHGSVWTANSHDGTVSRIDPENGAVRETTPVGSGPRAIAVSPEGLWVTNEFEGTVSQIDPASGVVVDEVVVGNAPQGAVVANEQIWFATRARLQGHRGGTLRVLSGSPVVDSIDPAIAYSQSSWQVMILAHDGLVSFKKVGGADGGTLVPDLAVSIPAPTDSGRTYTFQLRPDLRYSDGRPVEAAHVRSSMERLYRLNPELASFFNAIEGAEECGSEACELSRGIVTDNSSGTVTFNLAAPDPEFLLKLALPFASVLPSDAPLVEITEPILPATGPYMIDEHTPDHLSMVRNPEFVEWSPAAQPDGYVDEITLIPGPGEAENAARTVENNENDVMTIEFDPPQDLVERLQREHTERVYLRPMRSTVALVMNTLLPPFDDVDVRRAINYAVDREKVVQLFGGPELSQLTCQVLPPTVPGYEPYCPYTRNSKANRWSAPDLGRARSLIESSGYQGTRVVVYDAPLFHGVGKYVADLMTDLGFRADVKMFDDVGAYFQAVADSRTKAQIFGVGWFADYPVPSNFLHLLFHCDQYVPKSPANLNYAAFCDPGIDRDMEKAFRLDNVNPAAGREQWASVDRQVVDEAPWAPLLNTESVGFVSERVGNYQYHPQWGVLLGQLWVE